MRKLVLVGSVAVLLVFSATALSAYAQQVTAKIPFEFQVEKKTLPAGTYTVALSNANAKALTLRNQGTGATTQVPIITRLAAKTQSDLDPHLVFDKADEAHALAEFWLPGMDGFYLGGFMTMHSHVTIKASK